MAFGRIVIGAAFALLMAGSAHAQLVGGCPGGEGARSVNSDVPVRISFRNATDETLTAFWLNFSGAREKFADIEAGERWSIDTYAGHPWAFVNQYGQCLDLHVVRAGERRYTIR